MGANREPTDHELIQRIDNEWPDIHEPFERLYARHKAFVLRIAERTAGDADAAQDAVQEVFIALLGRFPGFKLQGRLTTFLYPLARNHAATIARKRASRARALTAKAILDEAADDPAPRPDRFAPLRDAVSALPEGQREVLLLRVVEGMSVGEVAIAMGLPTGTVKSRLHAALAALRADPRAAGYFE